MQRRSGRVGRAIWSYRPWSLHLDGLVRCSAVQCRARLAPKSLSVRRPKKDCHVQNLGLLHHTRASGIWALIRNLPTQSLILSRFHPFSFTYTSPAFLTFIFSIPFERRLAAAINQRWLPWRLMTNKQHSPPARTVRPQPPLSGDAMNLAPSLCNACGLFLKLHGRPRPISLKTDVIKSRNRVKTMRPGMEMKKKVRRQQSLNLCSLHPRRCRVPRR